MVEMKTVIITGASGNLGRAVTRFFLDKGYRVVAIIHNEEGKKILDSHEHLQVEVADLVDESTSQQLISRITSQHTIHGALMLAGGYSSGDTYDTGMEDIHKMISLNFSTAYNVSRHLLKNMAQNNFGRLVFIGAKAALEPGDGKKMVAYALSKSLLLNWADIINKKAEEKNLSAHVIIPSTIDTEANRKAMPNADTSKWIKPADMAEIMDKLFEPGKNERVIKLY